MNRFDLGRELVKRRRRAGLSQAELAARMRTTQPAISKVESGRTLPSLDLLERFANATGEPIRLTLGGTARMPSRAELRRRVRLVLGDEEFNPWERNPTPAEAESLLADGLTRERFARAKAARARTRRA